MAAEKDRPEPDENMPADTDTAKVEEQGDVKMQEEPATPETPKN